MPVLSTELVHTGGCVKDVLGVEGQGVREKRKN